MTVSVFSNWKHSISKQLQKCLYRTGIPKLYRYDVYNLGFSFELDTTLEPRYYYMTSQRPGVLIGDYIGINHPKGMTTYQVKEIDYYEEPPDMWMAKLLHIEPL